MSNSGTQTTKRGPAGNGDAALSPIELSAEDQSKDAFFAQLAGIAEAMTTTHGKDFAIGTLVLAARFIAEGKPLTKGAASDS